MCVSLFGRFRCVLRKSVSQSVTRFSRRLTTACTSLHEMDIYFNDIVYYDNKKRYLLLELPFARMLELCFPFCTPTHARSRDARCSCPRAKQPLGAAHTVHKNIYNAYLMPTLHHASFLRCQLWVGGVTPKTQPKTLMTTKPRIIISYYD